MSRYHDNNYLEYQCDLTDKVSQWEFILDSNCANYVRVGIDEKDEHNFTFIDPSGGPFLSIGSKVNYDDNIKYEIKKIFEIYIDEKPHYFFEMELIKK